MRSCVSASPGKNKISLIVETLPYWIVASPLIHHYHAPHFCQNISKVTSQRPIFSYFHFSLLPFVLANNNNTLFFLLISCLSIRNFIIFYVIVSLIILTPHNRSFLLRNTCEVSTIIFASTRFTFFSLTWKNVLIFCV